MKTEELKKDIFFVGVPDAERRLFDELIPLPDGTSYNSYLVKGKNKVALIDTVDPPKENQLIANLEQLGVKKIDYVIAHHGEQDHSGSIPTILKLFPEAIVVTNQKCKDELKDHLLVPEEKFITVADGEEIDLGGKTLKFIFTPWVHWPETMCTYLPEDKILFSCDFFGSHIGVGDIHVRDKKHVLTAAKRYYAEIMMPFRTAIKNNLIKIEPLAIEMICPSHGPIYDEPKFIIDAYKDWISDTVKNEVVIPYVSMHGSTAKMVDYLVQGLEKQGVTVKTFELSKMDVGELAMALVDAATVVVGSPTVLVGPHPLALYATYLFNVLRPKTKFLSVIGSYGWGGKMVDQLKALLASYRGEVLQPVVIKGYPKADDLVLLDKLIETIVQKHREVCV
ncbi:MAG: FprA family A-type flavoprotein [bacterium]